MKKLHQSGFTLTEILVVAPVVMLTIIIVMSFLFNQYGQLTQQGAQINLQVEAQNITFSMQDDIFYASGFASILNDNLIDSYQPSGGWKYDSTPETLIISTPALTGNHRAEDRQPVYIDTEGCDPSVVQENSPLLNNVIYFVDGSNLYKRIVTAPDTLQTCGTSFFRQSCPQSSSNPTCPSDRLVTDKLDAFNIVYFDAAGTEVDTPEQASKIHVNIQLKDRAYANDIYATSSITLKKLN